MRSCQLVGGLGVGCLVLAGLAGLAACASQAVETEWEPADGARFVSEDGAFALELPRGWLRSGHVLAREPDGVRVISFNAGPVLGGEAAQAVEASAPELIQAMSDQLATLPGVRVLECRPVTLDGLAGFRAHFLRSDPVAEGSDERVEREHLLYGAIEGEMLYAFALEAPLGLDFAEDLADFERLVASFRRLPAAR